MNEETRYVQDVVGRMVEWATLFGDQKGRTRRSRPKTMIFPKDVLPIIAEHLPTGT